MLLYKTRCPECASKGKDKASDNLGVYQDGHSYCFSCGYTQHSSWENKLEKRKKSINTTQDFPEDIQVAFEHTIPTIAKDWLIKYLDWEHWPEVYWSDTKQSLVFPIWIDNNLVAWQTRYFGNIKNHPKAISFGINKNIWFQYNHKSSTIIFVEDLISAKKISITGISVAPIFGSHLDIKRIVANKNKQIIFWLDRDKKEYQEKIKQQLIPLGISVKCISTKQDPKELSLSEIRSILKHELE